jgi:hypothetical protein
LSIDSIYLAGSNRLRLTGQKQPYYQPAQDELVAVGQGLRSSGRDGAGSRTSQQLHRVGFAQVFDLPASTVKVQAGMVTGDLGAFDYQIVIVLAANRDIAFEEGEFLNYLACF